MVGELLKVVLSFITCQPKLLIVYGDVSQLLLF